MLMIISISLQNVLGKTDSILFDIAGLYSSIPYEYGLEAIEHWLDPRISKECGLESVKFILENNNIKFDNGYFNQIKGTAMDAIFYPTYVN